MLVLTFFDAATQSMEFDDQCALFCSLFEKNSNLYPHLLSVKKHKAILKCSDHGVPQDRERLFLLGTRAGKVPVFPPPIQAGPLTVEVGGLFCPLFLSLTTLPSRCLTSPTG